MRMLGVGAALAAALTLAGCDFIYGVTRIADLESPIELACVQHTIETVPGIVSVEARSDHSGKGLFHPTPWVYSYLYSGAPGSNIRGALQIYREYDGKFSYHNMLLQMNERPPQEAIDATRPVMRAIEKKLAANCGVATLPAEVREDCNGVACKSLGED